MSSKIRVVLAKPGLDGHTRGMQVVARGLSGAGCEVIYLGLYKTAEQIVKAAVEEDAEVIGLSILSGASPTGVCRQVFDLLALHGAGDVAVVVGGIIHADEAQTLREMGVVGVFLPGTPMDEIVCVVQTEVEKLRSQRVGIAST